MAPLGGVPSLECLVRRVRRAPSVQSVVIATTAGPEDQPIVALAGRLGVACHRGSEDDVMARVLDAARSVDLDVVVHVTGDCPLVDPAIVEQTLALFFSSGADYAKNFQWGADARPERGFPNGLDVEVFWTRCLAEAAATTTDPWLRQHVTEPLYTSPRFRVATLEAPPALAHPELRICIDTREDYELLKAVFGHFHPGEETASALQVVEFLLANPHLLEINATVKQRKYDAAVIGLGMIGSLYDADPKLQGVNSHSGAYTRWSKTRLVGGCDPDAGRRQAFRERWGQDAVFASPQEMLDALHPEVVSICSPSSLHESHLRLCLDRGVKAVLCEKPFVDNVGAGAQIVQACQAAGVHVAVNHWLRYSDLYQDLRQFVQSGGLGELIGGRYHYSKGLYNSGSHAVDLLRFLLGEVVAVRATDVRDIGGSEPNVGGVLHFAGGIAVHLTVGDYRDHFTTELDLHGRGGRVCVSDNERQVRLFRSADSAHETGIRELAPVEPVPFQTGRGDFLVNAVANLVDALEGRSALICTAADGLASIRVLDALWRSSEGNGSYESV